MFKNKILIKFLIFFIFCFYIFPTISQSNENIPFNNIVRHKVSKPISPIVFEDFLGNKVHLNDYLGKIVIINFWATWCQPCKEEMPSLDQLYLNKNFKNLQIFAVNMEKKNISKTKNFFKELKIEKLEIFFDENLSFVKEFKLRGVPTTVLINKNGKEFARIKGAVDFQNKKFIKWLKSYD